ncbi:MAG: polysaccharide biosynthesis/export family protein [Hyphomicrobiaceae bacterium]
MMRAIGEGLSPVLTTRECGPQLNAVVGDDAHPFLLSLARILLVVAFLGVVLAGCAQQQGASLLPETSLAATASADPALVQPASLAVGTPAYKLGPGDKVKVVVFREEQLSGEFEIDSTGHFSMPLVGRVEAAGHTQQELEQSITAALANGYLKDPKVSVLPSDLRPIYVLGEVKTAGEYPFKSGLNAVSAVALAGGFTYRADSSRVFIRRANEAFEREFPAAPTIVVMPGDTVRVAERYF